MFGSSHELKRLWVEEFRPTSIDNYVFKNPQLKSLVENWISTKDIPHVLFHGPAGTGKCLGPNEQVTVKIDVNQLTSDQKEYLRTII